MERLLLEIGESLKKLSTDAEQRTRGVMGLTEIMTGRSKDLSRQWEETVSTACDRITQAAGSAEYLQGNARDLIELLSRMIEDLRRETAQSRARERRRIVWTAITTSFVSSLLVCALWRMIL